MWFEILCGFVVYKILRRFIHSDDSAAAAAAGVDSSHSDLCFAVASRLEKLYRGRSFVGLRVPDPDSASLIHLDVVLLTKREVMVFLVKNFSGFAKVGDDGSWMVTGDEKRKTETYPDPVFEIIKLAANLQSYLEQRGVQLPDGHITGRILLPNVNSRVSHSIDIIPEVVSYDKWKDMKPGSDIGVTNWIKDTFHGGKNGIQDILYQKLSSTLCTTPMWDRLELKGDRNILGKFIEFKGNHEDIHNLRNLNRSKVNQIVVQRPSFFGNFARSRLLVLYSLRDYRVDGASSEWKEVSVKPHTELLFQPFNSKKSRKFKLSSTVSLTLSA